MYRLHWLPIQYIINFKIMLLVYKALNGMTPQFITDLLSLRLNIRRLPSSS